MKNPKTLLIFCLFISLLGLTFLSMQACSEEGDSSKEDAPKLETEVLTGTNPSSLPARSFIVPVSVPDTSDQTNYYEFGWQSFIALNWPANPNARGNPDTTKQIGDAANKVVWEAYKEKFDVLKANAVRPSAWTTQDTLYCGGQVVPPGSKVIGGVTKNMLANPTEDDFDEAGSNAPLIDSESEYIRFEIRIAESEFNYLLNTGYYDGAKQKADVSAKKFQDMPKTGAEQNAQPLNPYTQFGSTEIKASWRIFPEDTDESTLSRYYTQTAYLENPDNTCLTGVTIGLVGLHIVRLTPKTGSTWYWATFEQVDNVSLNPAYGGTPPAHPTFNSNYPTTYPNGYSYKPDEIESGSPLPSNPPVMVSRTDSILSEIETINLQYNQKLNGTVWQYYQMVGTVNPPTEGHYVAPSGIVPPANIASMYNTTLETYTGGNCISCHSFGFPQGASQWQTSDPTYYKDLQIFTFLLSDAASSE